MVNEERLHYMIKMAEFDKNEGKECRPMIQYARKDYISMRLLGSFVYGTIGFMIVFAMWAVYSTDRLMAEINTMDIKGFLVSIFVKYVLFLIVYFAVTYAVYNRRYTRGRKKVKKYYSNLKKLSQIYEREEKLRTSDSRDWD